MRTINKTNIRYKGFLWETKNKPKAVSLPVSNKASWKNSPCQCLICGELLLTVTHTHAEKHGYNTKDDMWNDNKLKVIKKLY